MRELPVQWKTGSWNYEQVWREGDFAIYKQSHTQGPAIRYEIIIVQHREHTVFPNGTVQEAGDYYPSSSQWGKAGWTCYTLDEAQQLLQETHDA